MIKCVLTDTHHGLYKDSMAWQKVIYNLFDEVIKTCRSRGISKIYHLGDWFENRKSLNPVTINVSLQIANKLKDFDTYVVVGNHDMYYKIKILPTSLQIFSKYKNMHIVYRPMIIGDDVLIPWLIDENEIRNIKKSRFCYGHFDINGSYTNRKKVSDSGIGADVFDHFDKVFSGHFHLHSINNNIKYIGSPYQQSFNDYNEEKGFYIIDDDGSHEFIRFNKYPHFVKIHINGDEIKEYDNVNGNIVHIIFHNDIGSIKTDQVIDSIREMKPLHYETSFNTKTDENPIRQAEDVSFEFNDMVMMENYIMNTDVPKNISRDMAVKFLRKIMEDIDV